MNINFVSIGNKTLASYRYHNMIPSGLLTNLGHNAIITKAPLPDYDVYVFSKHLNEKDQNYILECRGKKVFHCCDNHFYTKKSEHYRTMIDRADMVITTTNALKEIIKQETGKEAVLIPDTVEWPEAEPFFHRHGILKLLWYGHTTNLPGLVDIVNSLCNYRLKICTTLPEESNLKINPAAYVPYSDHALDMCFEWCDAVIIPVNMNDKKIVKSHNRLSEAVRCGKFVIASPLESYKEFADYMYIGDVIEGIKWIETQKEDEIMWRVQKAQKHIVDNYSQEKVGHLWEKALSGLI